jgi:hypothetical protein
MLPLTIVATIAVLTVFLSFLIVIKYAVKDDFLRRALIMTSFFIFIVLTLTLSYLEFFFATLPYTIPAGAFGMLAGYLVGVRAAERKLSAHGIQHYTEHFAHIHINDITELNWWAIFNYYTVMGALALINLVGLTTVIFHNLKPLTLATSAFGAFLIGTLIPYLTHLWMIRMRHNTTRNTSE